MKIESSWKVEDRIVIGLQPEFTPIHMVIQHVEEVYKPKNGLIDVLPLGKGFYRLVLYTPTVDIVRE